MRTAASEAKPIRRKAHACPVFFVCGYSVQRALNCSGKVLQAYHTNISTKQLTNM